MNHQAIYSLYPNVVSIDDEAGPIDANGNLVKIDKELVESWVDPQEYSRKRRTEYPTIVEQLDTIFHEGIDVWKEQIQAVKDKYPKP